MSTDNFHVESGLEDYGLKQRDGDQQLPVKNNEPDCQTTFLSRIRTDVTVRREVGIQRYGTALQPFNSRDAMRDAWEEFIDLGQYIEQLRREREAMIGLLRELVVNSQQVANDHTLLKNYDGLSEQAEQLLVGMGTKP